MEVEVPNIPHIPSKGVHQVPFVPNEIYIECSDFKEVLFMVHVHGCSISFHLTSFHPPGARARLPSPDSLPAGRTKALWLCHHPGESYQSEWTPQSPACTGTILDSVTVVLVGKPFLASVLIYYDASVLRRGGGGQTITICFL